MSDSAKKKSSVEAEELRPESASKVASLMDESPLYELTADPESLSAPLGVAENGDIKTFRLISRRD
jgi:hypothetical protein